MKTNLIFKRQQTVDGITKVVTRIVPVEVPYIEENEGWILSGHADVIERYDDLKPDPIPAKECAVKTEVDSSVQDTKKLINPGEKFDSPVLGTAKIFRKNDKIGIAYRRGKKTLNQNTKDSVCVSDVVKSNFFTAVKNIYGTGVKEYAIYDHSKQFEFWNNFIDEEYERQRKVCNDKILAEN